MNLEDILKGRKLELNSKVGEKFGTGNLEIVGYFKDEAKSHRAYEYIVKCSVCENDSELFGGGYFRCIYNNLVKGRIPCGCSYNYRKSDNQLELLLKRSLEDTPHLSFTSLGGLCGVGRSKVLLLCEHHGEFETGVVNVLHRGIKGCLSCRTDSSANSKRLPDEQLVERFMQTGKFTTNTVFTRSKTNHWNTFCPTCQETNESHVSALLKGCLPCSCFLVNQRYAYLNKFSFADEAYLKFGISCMPDSRQRQQELASGLNLSRVCTYIFEDNKSCRQAEKECKFLIETGVVGEDIFPDGYTETTYVFNLDKIKEVYKKHGGVEV
jgi:hypothetical protein